MDFESTSVTGRAGLDLFVRDVALCLSVNRDRTPALVWPEGIEAVVAAAREAPPLGTPPPSPEVPYQAAELTERLGALLGCTVVSSSVALARGARHTGTTTETDLVLLPVHGSCGGRVEPTHPPHPSSPRPPHTLDLRLRVGEALYLPRGYTYTLNDVHTPCTLQLLGLHAPAW
ncbi:MULTISPECIES: hypothetical protein [unclassified Streptomyces]|uniref:hypothetical protein n=1 Tax=unclassified Streptomyces TaxID=2593676 RepID=UPI002253FF30|nr:MULTISPECIES: hypothetical protein [unclassified Streptomyces]MCX4918666.1 hypothetical protein [Streptomyces sp. NBC_00687]MCX5280761.1 hypothetical protein [Streptomyces sp. NBC_00198]